MDYKAVDSSMSVISCREAGSIVQYVRNTHRGSLCPVCHPELNNMKKL